MGRGGLCRQRARLLLERNLLRQLCGQVGGWCGTAEVVSRSRLAASPRRPHLPLLPPPRRVLACSFPTRRPQSTMAPTFPPTVAHAAMQGCQLDEHKRLELRGHSDRLHIHVCLPRAVPAGPQPAVPPSGPPPVAARGVVCERGRVAGQPHAHHGRRLCHLLQLLLGGARR